MHPIQSARLVFYKRQQTNQLFEKSFNYYYPVQQFYFKQLWFSYVIMNIHIYTFLSLFFFFFEGKTLNSTTRQISILFSTITTHPSSLTYFHLHSYPSSARLSWSVNYIDLTPNRTRKRKCRYLDQASLAGI
jgi:hypothetical protein